MSKRRGNGEGLIRQRTDGRWETRVSLSAGGTKSYYGKSRREVQDKLKEAIRDLDNGLDLSDGTQTIAQFLTRWLDDVAKPGIRPSTFESYSGHVRNHLIPGIGRHQLRNLTPAHVQTLMNDKTKAGLSPRTVAYMRAVLRRALGQATAWGMVPRNVAALAKPPRAIVKPVQPLSAEQVRVFLEATKDDRLGPLFHVAIASGLRQGELFGLRWEDVNLATGELSVRYALQRVDKRPMLVEPKTQRSRRTITLPNSAVAALVVQRDRQIFERQLAGDRWQDWGLIFVSSIGTPLNPSNVTHRFQEFLAVAGLPRQRFHDLRHCSASLMLAQGVAARTIMERLGHSQISLTMNTYAHLSPALVQEAARALDSVLTAGA